MKFACFICGAQENLWKNLDKICVIKCGHTFHPDCMKKQINSMATLSPSQTMFCPVSSCKKIVKQNQIVFIDRVFIENHYRLRKNKPVICSLCEDPVVDPAGLGVTRCGHIYHYRCIYVLVRRRSEACLVESCKKNITVSSITQAIGLSRDTPSDRSGSEDRIALRNEKCTNNRQCQQTTDITQRKGARDEPSKASGSGDGIELRIEKSTNSGHLKSADESRSNSPILCKKGTKHKKVTFDDDIEFIKKRYKMDSSAGKVESHCLSDEKLKDQIHYAKDGNSELEELKRKFEELEEKKNAIAKDYEKAKEDLQLWEMSYTYLDKMMMSDEQSRKIAAENVSLKNEKQQLEKELSNVKNDAKSVETLRTDLKNALKENSELKSVNEELKRDLSEVKDDMKTMDEMIMECKESHMQEKKQLNEMINSLAMKNTDLKKRNETLLIENNKLKNNVINLTQVVKDNPQKNRPHSSEHNETVFTENNKQNDNLVINQQNDHLKLNELNKTMQNEIKSLNEVNRTLLKENNELILLNDTLLSENQTLRNENDKLNDVNKTLDKDNHDLQLLNEPLRNNNNKPNKTLLNENDTLSDGNKTLDKDKHALQLLNETLRNENNKPNETLLNETDTFNNGNKTQQNENNKLNDVSKTLNKDNHDLQLLNEALRNKNNKPNETLLNENDKLNNGNKTEQNENNTLNDVNKTLDKDNDCLNVLNKALQIDNIKLNELNETPKNDNNKSNADNDTLLDNNNLVNNLNKSPQNKIPENNIEMSELRESIHKNSNKMCELNQKSFDNNTNLNVLPEDTIRINSLNVTCITMNIESNEQNTSLKKDNGALGQRSRSEGPSINFKVVKENERNKIELSSDESTTQITINNHNPPQNDTANSKEILNRNTISLDKNVCDSQWEMINRRLSRHSTS